MKSGVKHADLGNARHCFFTSLDTYKVRRVVQGCQRRTFFYCVLYLIIDNNRLAEKLAAVYDTMTHRGNLAHIRDNAVVFVCQSVKNHRDCIGMVFHIFFYYNLIFSVRGVIEF